VGAEIGAERAFDALSLASSSVFWPSSACLFRSSVACASRSAFKACPTSSQRCSLARSAKVDAAHSSCSSPTALTWTSLSRFRADAKALSSCDRLPRRASTAVCASLEQALRPSSSRRKCIRSCCSSSTVAAAKVRYRQTTRDGAQRAFESILQAIDIACENICGDRCFARNVWNHRSTDTSAQWRQCVCVCSFTERERERTTTTTTTTITATYMPATPRLRTHQPHFEAARSNHGALK